MNCPVFGEAYKITNDGTKQPLFSFLPNRTNSTGVIINSSFTENDSVKVTIKLHSGDITLHEEDLVLNFKEDNSLKNINNSSTENAAGYFIYDSIFNPSIGQNKLEALAQNGSIKAACWLAIFSKIGFIHHPTSLYLNNRALVVSNYGDSLLQNALKGDKESLFLLSFMRDARNLETKSFIISDSKSMMEKVINDNYYPALWANKIINMNVSKNNPNKSKISYTYINILKRVSNLKTIPEFVNFSQEDLHNFKNVPEIELLNNITMPLESKSYATIIKNILSEDNKFTIIPLLCKLISLNDNDYFIDHDKIFIDSLFKEAVKMKVAVAMFEVGKKELQINKRNKDALDLVEQASSLGYKPAINYLVKLYIDKSNPNFNEKKAIFYVETANYYNRSKIFNQNFDYSNHSWRNIFNNIQIDEIHEVRRTYVNGTLQSVDESKSIDLFGSFLSTALGTLMDAWKQSQPNYNSIWKYSDNNYLHYYGLLMGELSTDILIPAGSQIKKIELGEISAGFMVEKSTPKGFRFGRDEKKKEISLPYLSLMYKINGIWYNELDLTSDVDRKITAISINEKYTLNNIGYYTFLIDIFK